MAQAQGNENGLIEIVRVREAVGVVHSREQLEKLIERLTTSGFDRAAINLMASQDAILRKLGTVYLSPADAADAPGVPRRKLVLPSDEAGLTAGWLPHTTRAALTGLRNRGFAIECLRNEQGTVYRFVFHRRGFAFPDRRLSEDHRLDGGALPAAPGERNGARTMKKTKMSRANVDIGMMQLMVREPMRTTARPTAS